jgi:hypothetical protein
MLQWNLQEADKLLALKLEGTVGEMKHENVPAFQSDNFVTVAHGPRTPTS